MSWDPVYGDYSVPSGQSSVTTWVTGGGYLTFGFVRATPSPVPTAAPTVNVPASTGVSPVETQYSLYGHIVPLSLGKVRIGGEIISGPWINNGLASFIISFGVPADLSDTRTLLEIAFDSEVVWTGSLVGAGTPSSSGFTVEPFTVRFYDGKLTQAADALETANFGANAVAYRPQILLAFENLPIANTKFKKIPYVAAVIQDSTGGDVNFGTAFDTLAYSPWVGYTSAQFETIGITDGVTNGGMIFAQDAEFLSTIQQFGRFYPNWDILQTDKLRIVDRSSSVTPDVVLNSARLMDKVIVTRQGADTIKKDLELSTIDPDSDYTIVPSRAQRPRDPVAVTTSVGVDTAYLPVVMDSSTRIAIVTFAKYHEEATRKSISGTSMCYGLQFEPGDLVQISALGDDFATDVFRVTDTLHGINYAVEFTAVPILKCNFSDPDFAGVVLLLGFNGANGSTVFVDESPRAHGTAQIDNGTPHVDGSVFKFASGSLSLTGIVPQISFPDSDDWRLSAANTDQFTIECFARARGLAYDAMLVGQIAGTGNSAWWLRFLTSGEFQFQSSSNGATFPVDITSSGAALGTGAWYHLAVDKDATGKIRLYKDGVMKASATPADSTMHNANDRLCIGCRPGDNSFDGWIDELRITKGIARYASDAGFTPPSSPFPRS